jgi:hypothetical protein
MATNMKKFLLIAAVCGIPATTIPAIAQVDFDANQGGTGVNRLDDPNYGWPQSHWRRGYDSYARGECRVVRERVVMPDGRVIDRSREVCG